MLQSSLDHVNHLGWPPSEVPELVPGWPLTLPRAAGWPLASDVGINSQPRGEVPTAL